ncbi:MAG: PAS domain S-box protein, partial [Acidobacteriota bacterium]
LPDPLPSTPLVLTEGGTHRAFLPLRQYGTLCGVLCVASKEAGTFDSEVMGLLGELALDLSFALEVQETRERKEEAERALRENEERLRLALRAAEQGLYDLNVQTGSCVVSPEYATMLGFDPDTFVETNQAWIDRLHPEDRESVAEAYRAYVAGKVLEYRVEFRQRCADGSWKWILSQGKIVGFDTEGRPLRMLGTHTDITGRKAAEEALRRHEASLRGLYESMSEMLALHEVVCDESGRAVDYRLIECNAAFEKVTGLPRSKACGALASELYGTGEAPFLDAYARVAATGEPIQFEAEFAPMNKHFLISAYSPEKGRFATLALDVTDQVRAQAEQRFLHNAMNASLNEIYVFDAATWKFEFVSRGALQNLGYTLEEMRSKTPVDIKPAFTDASFGEAVAPLLSGELQVLHFETEHERADGTRYPVEVHLQLFDQGKRKVFVAFILDITERERAAEALRESEEKYRSILENMQESYYEVDLAGNLTFFNDSLCALFGYPREELMGMNNRQYTDPENAKRLYRAFNEVYRTGIPTRGFGWEVIRKDGSIRTIEASVSLRKDSNGRPVGFRGLIRDVTEERRAQEALRQSEERFRTLFENSPVGMYRTTPDGRIVEANPKIVSLLGFRSFEELANRNLEEDGFEPSYPREVFKAEMEAAGEVRGLESAWRRRDGQVLRIREHARAVRDDSGRIVCYDGVVEDISAAHRAEEARRLLSTAIEQSHDAVVITDRDGTILYVNPAFERITGYTREEAVGQNPRILKSGVQDEAFYKNLWETILSGHVWTGRLTNRRKDGTHFVEQAVISPVRDEAGAIVTFVAAKRDITQEVELEKRLEHAKSLETIGMVAGGMAHEVRNPLFAISTLTSALDKKFGANEEIRPFIGYIQEHVQRLTDLMNDLLALGRPVARDQFAPCDLCGLAHSVRDLLAKANADGASRLDVDCTTGDAQVLGHPEKISQILLNLVQNALHFSPPDGRVLLKVYRWGDVGVIHVVDRGAGIPADFLPRLFQPFASRRQGGTGLGLAIVRKLVEAHGGTVEGANNTPGPGATFTVRLPLM